MISISIFNSTVNYYFFPFLQQQRYNNPTNPYLASNQEKKKGDSKGKSEFVDDDFDSGSDGKTSY